LGREIDEHVSRGLLNRSDETKSGDLRRDRPAFLVHNSTSGGMTASRYVERWVA
jgi:hypothetical protein